MSITIQVRRDTAANWTSVNPVLNQGEMGLETDTATGSGQGCPSAMLPGAWAQAASEGVPVMEHPRVRARPDDLGTGDPLVPAKQPEHVALLTNSVITTLSLT